MKKILFSLSLAASTVAFASPVSLYSPYTDTHTYQLTQTYQLNAPKGSEGEMKLWVPLPFDSAYQQVKQITFNGNYQQAYITDNNAYGAKTLFVQWDSHTQSRELNIDLTIETRDREVNKQQLLGSYQAPTEPVYPLEVQVYLQPTQHIKIDGIVKQFADKIVGEEKDPLQQAKRIHQWIVDNMERDNNVIGCGDGDVERILTTGVLKGKCTDINSIFVALARAVGIPAREVFGIRLGESKKLAQYSTTAFGSSDENKVANVSGGQHCRAEFYLAGFGWVPVDSADVTKMRLAENKAVNDPATQAVSDYLFGNWEMNWVGFNYARDFDLYPKPELAPLNNFGYPYAEINGDPLNFFNPKTFSYEFIAKEIQ